MLAEIMRKRGIDDKQLAKILNCSQSKVYDWRNGSFSKSFEAFAKLCNYLDCSADDLLGITTRKPQGLTREQYTGLIRAVTKDGRMTSESIHNLASAIRKMHGNKLSVFEVWIRDIAESVYTIEISRKQKTLKEELAKQTFLL